MPCLRPLLTSSAILASAAALFTGCANNSATTSASATPAPVAAKPAPVKTPQELYFSNWPAGTSPQEVGQRVAENFAGRQFRWETTTRGPKVIYPEVVAWYGALTFAVADKDVPLETKLVRKFDFYLTPEGATHYPPAQIVDDNVFGAVPAQIYLRVKDQRYLDLAKSFADRQIANVVLPNGGYSSQARFWSDDLYMLPIVQISVARATGDQKYLDFTAALFAAYLDRLQQPNGLFFHGPGAPYHWGRGNGWVAAGMTELLSDLPATNPHYARIMQGYQLMMSNLLKYQGEDGLWKQLVDHPEAWGESSGTAMFTFAMVTGVKKGWLDAATYGPAARKAWLALVPLIDENGNIAKVCVGTNAYNPNSANTGQGMEAVQYYLSRRTDEGADMLTSDVLHGNAPVLWTATALIR